MAKTLVVAEKPSAGKDIARILGCTESHKDYIESSEYIVTWAVGHLVTRKTPEDIDIRYKSWNLEDLPVPTDNGLKVIDSTRHQFKIIKELIHRPDVGRLVNAGDAGREGLLIQEWIYRLAGNRLPVDILWASSLTDEAVKTAFQSLHSNQEEEFKNLLIEAETRSEADQKYGFNYSRMLTLLYANPGTVLSYGRCQTPLLNLIVLRDIAYETFKSEPFWQIEATYQKGFKGTLIDTETGETYRSVQKEAAEDILNSLAGKPGIVLDYQSEEKSQKAPQLLNLAELQTVMGKKYGFPPDKTLTIAQKLYEDYKIMSYPRTDSQFLTNDLFNEIKEHLKVCDFGIFREFIRKIDFESITMDKAYFNNNKVSDHHALIPTINADMESIYAKLPDDERHCFNEVVCRLIAVFLSPYRYESVNIRVQIDEKIFSSSGTTIRELGYKAINKLLSENKKMGIVESSELQILPEMNKGDSVKVDGLSLSEGKTKPPSRYTPGTIIQLMKKYKIGTSATSASIITTLLNRGFINLEKGKYISTSLGRELINIIPDELKSPNLTIQFEENLQKVNCGELSKEQFLQEIDERIMENLKKFQENGNKKKLGSENISLKCPLCGRDIRRGKTKSGKINWYCTGYAEETPCNFKLWQEISGKKLTEQNAADLLQGKRTAVIQGFVSKSSGNKFSAALRLKEDGSIEFLFPATKSKNRRNGGK